MPVLKHAKKKLRQDKIRTLKNKRVRSVYKHLSKEAKESPSDKTLSAAFKSIDKAAKLHLIHKNKAARLKSSLAKNVQKLHKPSVEKKGETSLKKETLKRKAKKNTSSPLK